MDVTLVLKILTTALSLAEAGSEVATFLDAANTRLRADQAAGTDPTAADWAFLDGEAAANLAAVEKLTGSAS